MVSDSVVDALIPASVNNPRDFAKKKRANRSAKLKQCKRDARRKQWLSQGQVKNKDSKEEPSGGATYGPASIVGKMRGQDVENLEINQSLEEEIDESINHYTDSESSWNSPSSQSSSVSGSCDSVTNFTGSRCSSSAGFCSGSISEVDEEGDDGCLDDWEAVADALAATEDKQEHHNPNSDLPPEQNTNTTQQSLRPQLTNELLSGTEVLKPRPGSGDLPQRSRSDCRTWRHFDAPGPEILPSLSKQHSLPTSSERHHIRGGSVWGCRVVSAPKSCPICYEDFDLTDASFLPCQCGFRICLFCHKRILEDDGRCPGCRKPYQQNPIEGEATLEGRGPVIRLARSCSMVSRS